MAKENKRRKGREIVKASVALPGAVATETSLTLPEDITQEECANLLRGLLRSQSRNQWFIGDTINQSEDRWKEYTRILLEEFAPESLKNLARVCEAIPPARRRGPPLSYSHHVVIYDLPEKDQEEWLSRAEDEGWSVSYFRDQVKGRPKGAEEPSSERDHTKIQGLLLQLGRDMGYKVWVARNDRSKAWLGKKFKDMVLKTLPRTIPDARAQKIIELIDVLWIDARSIVNAFEIEHTTPVYSGLLRMCDLLAIEPYLRINLYIVAPAAKRGSVARQVNRPTFAKLELGKKCRLITFERLLDEIERLGELTEHVKDSFLPWISESCELPEGDTSTLEED